MKKLIIITLFIYTLLIGSIISIGDRSTVNPYIEEPNLITELQILIGQR